MRLLNIYQFFPPFAIANAKCKKSDLTKPLPVVQAGVICPPYTTVDSGCAMKYLYISQKQKLSEGVLWLVLVCVGESGFL